uniref:Uncharacterized protein n=1 Tax=Candidozyma auris TaxID=498019 RepID=A0A0L0NUI4_CANAR
MFLGPNHDQWAPASGVPTHVHLVSTEGLDQLGALSLKVRASVTFKHNVSDRVLVNPEVQHLGHPLEGDFAIVVGQADDSKQKVVWAAIFQRAPQAAVEVLWDVAGQRRMLFLMVQGEGTAGGVVHGASFKRVIHALNICVGRLKRKRGAARAEQKRVLQNRQHRLGASAARNARGQVDEQLPQLEVVQLERKLVAKELEEDPPRLLEHDFLLRVHRPHTALLDTNGHGRVGGRK